MATSRTSSRRISLVRLDACHGGGEGAVSSTTGERGSRAAHDRGSTGLRLRCWHGHRVGARGSGATSSTQHLGGVELPQSRLPSSALTPFGRVDASQVGAATHRQRDLDLADCSLRSCWLCRTVPAAPSVDLGANDGFHLSSEVPRPPLLLAPTRLSVYPITALHVPSAPPSIDHDVAADDQSRGHHPPTKTLSRRTPTASQPGRAQEGLQPRFCPLRVFIWVFCDSSRIDALTACWPALSARRHALLPGQTPAAALSYTG